MRPFLEIEQTHWEKFNTREEARAFLRKVKQNPLFLKNDEIKQYNYIYIHEDN